MEFSIVWSCVANIFVHPASEFPIIPKTMSITGKYILLHHRRDGLLMQRQIHGKIINTIFPRWTLERISIWMIVKSLGLIPRYTGSKQESIKSFLTNNVCSSPDETDASYRAHHACAKSARLLQRS